MSRELETVIGPGEEITIKCGFVPMEIHRNTEGERLVLVAWPRQSRDQIELDKIKNDALGSVTFPAGGVDGEGGPSEDLREQEGAAVGEGTSPEDGQSGAWSDQAQALRLCLHRLGRGF